LTSTKKIRWKFSLSRWFKRKNAPTISWWVD
jgi:hypothetical protein